MHQPARSSAFVFCIVSIAAFACRGTAQCATQWVSESAFAGADHYVMASTLWDPDGAGPLPQVLVVGGWFTVCGSVVGNRIVAFEPVSGAWSTFGSGMEATAATHVRALATMQTGELLAAGRFATAGGVACANIARWNGASWQPLGSGVNGTVNALAVMPNGDVVAGGDFTLAGGVAVNHVARWNGTAWSPLGAGTSEPVQALAALPNGDAVAGGLFGQAGGAALPYLARWNGASWSAFGAGLNGGVLSLLVLPGGDLVAGGGFTTAGGAPASGIARWNGTAWSAFGAGTSNPVQAIALAPDGTIVAGGSFGLAGGVQSNGVARWDGTAWSTLGPGPGVTTYTVTCLPSGDVVAGGSFLATPSGNSRLARWNGAAWTPLPLGLNGAVNACIVAANGDVIVAGSFYSIGGTLARSIARWNGASWVPLGAGLDGSVNAIVELTNGDVIAGGQFFPAGSPPFYVARWNGTAWTALPSPGGPVFALTALTNGFIIAGGTFPDALVIWNNTQWLVMGITNTFSPASPVTALKFLPDGSLIVGANLGVTVPGVGSANVVRWNGTAWSLLPGSSSAVNTFAVRANGDIVAGGGTGSTTGGWVQQWNGSTWFQLATTTGGPVRTLLTLPDDDLLVGGQFASIAGVAAINVARLDGATWLPVGAGTNGQVNALAALGNGDVFVGGVFSVAGGTVSAGIARLTTPCPALATPSGAGCTGSGGPNVLVATALPWLGSTFRARGTGMPALALVSIVTGFSPLSVPLSSLLPQGGPGCDLLVSPDFVEFAIANAGTVHTAIVIPGAPSLLGMSFLQQLNPFEVDAALNIVAVTASNALAMTIGGF